MENGLCEIIRGNGPLVAAAIHNGHQVRPEVAALLALDEQERQREEDPYTGQWTTIAPTRIIGRVSRFEVDLNRPEDKAVYRRRRDAWGLRVWKGPLDQAVRQRSLARYRAFYEAVEQLLAEMIRREGAVVVLDLHSYNHRRGGPDGPVADPEANPEINVGTGSVDRARWGRLVDRFIGDLRRFNFCGRPLDVRENVRFTGGHFPRWINGTFAGSACALAIEVKKIFMDEWTGQVNAERLEQIGLALASTVPGLLEEVRRC